MRQLSLSFSEAARDRIQDAFERFDREHPEVYAYFRRAAHELVAAGRRRIGAKAIYERMRWNTGLGEREREAYRLNNNYTSRLVRKLLAEEPQLEACIEVRRLKAQR